MISPRIKEAARVVYHDRALRLFWGFFVLVAVVTCISKCSEPMPRCRIIGDHEIDNGRCIPYCPPKPSECG